MAFWAMKKHSWFKRKIPNMIYLYRKKLYDDWFHSLPEEKQKQILKAPIDGYVNEVFVHTIGGVVTPAEKIMTIVPKDAEKQIKAKVSKGKNSSFICSQVDSFTPEIKAESLLSFVHS